MNPATRSILPWFTHRRMLPKWAGTLVTLAGVVWWGPSWLAIGVGILFFFPNEYLVHRHVFHHFANRPAGEVLSKQHVLHHETPHDLDYLFNDPRISVSFGVVYFLAAWGITGSLGTAASFSFGTFVGLLYYEWVHLAAHRPGSRPRTPWGKLLKRSHLWHHYKNEHYWFGVTNTWFDRLLGTWREEKEVEHSETVRTLVAPDEHVPWLEGRR